jgi:hypothetical protein
MESEAKQTTGVETSSGIKTDSPGMIAPTTTSPADQQLQTYVELGKEFFSDLYENLVNLISDNQKLLTNVGLILGAFIAVKITLAILDAINDIPLLAPLFELVGLAYTGWFVYRYMLKESTRQELVTEFEALKTQIMGKTEQ